MPLRAILKQALFASLASFWVTQAASAAGVVELTCADAKAPLGQIEERLAQSGWTVIKTPNQEVIEDIAWMNATFYFAGDSGGAALENVLELQRKSALGLFRKVDIPASQTRIAYHSTNGNTLVIMRRMVPPETVTLECRLAVHEYDHQAFHAHPNPQQVVFIPLGEDNFQGTRQMTTLIAAPSDHPNPPPSSVIFSYAQAVTD